MLSEVEFLVEDFLAETRPKWLEPNRSTPNKPAVILSHKFFLSRNIRKYPFLESTTAPEKEEIYRCVCEAIKKTNVFSHNKLIEIKMDNNNSMANVSLFEKDLISSVAAHSDRLKGVFADVRGYEFPIILVNVQNHLDITLYYDKGKEEQTLEKINKIDNVLGKELSYAYDSQFGFLFPKPEECGSGFSVETVLHLPGLVMTEEIKEVFDGLLVLGLKIEGMFGRETDCWGAFFRITTGNYSGSGEIEIIEKTKEIQNVLYTAEQKARKRLFKEAKDIMEDKIFRSFATLKYARILPISQYLNFISMLRLGCENKIIPLNVEFLSEMLNMGFFANMLFSINDDSKTNDFDKQRANIARFLLKNYEI